MYIIIICMDGPLLKWVARYLLAGQLLPELSQFLLQTLQAMLRLGGLAAIAVGLAALCTPIGLHHVAQEGPPGA